MFHLKFFIYEKDIAFVSPWRKREDSLIRLRFSCTGNAAFLLVLVCIVRIPLTF
jgi:hypothetical protein